MISAHLDGPVNLLSTVPPQHMWGLETSILLPMFTEVSISNRVPFYPRDVKEALLALPAPRMLVSTPVHLRALLNSGLNFGEVKLILTATAPLSRELAADIEKQLGTTVLDIFGCSESGILASRLTSRDETWTLADPFTIHVESDQVRVSAAHLPEDVFLQDLIETVGRARFRWLGRRQDLVNIAGKRGSLADINRRLLEISGVQDGIVFFPSEDAERLAALVVAPGKTARDIQDGLRHHIEPVFTPRPIVLVDGLPRAESGKLPRKAVLELFAGMHHPRASG
jgi:acyl-coenzyme A synthetase/AMP-(fatty) acid ligase